MKTQAGIHTPVTTSGWSLEYILSRSSRFQKVPQVPASIDSITLSKIIDEYEESGIPLVITGYHEQPGWSSNLFSVEWLQENGPKDLKARNIHTWQDENMKFREFVNAARQSKKFTSPGETQRLYGKDASCPTEWKSQIESSLGIPSKLLGGQENDALTYLPRDSQDNLAVETHLNYLGVGDTFTPMHKDLCASSGHNLMCYTENDGSAFWFLTASDTAPAVAQYFHDIQHELDQENHIITLEDLVNASFDIYIMEQHLGDLVLIPPRSCHQVVNYGGLTIKSSWSRVTVKGLGIALYHELPIYQRVCRKEIYRVKSNILHAVKGYTHKLTFNHPTPATRRHQTLQELSRLISFLDDVLVEEFCDRNLLEHLLTVFIDEPLDNDFRVECDFCGADIFQSFFECGSCDGLVICSRCYVDGRLCRCGDMKPIQYHNLRQLIDVRNEAAKLVFAVVPAHDHTYQNMISTEELSEELLSRLCEGDDYIPMYRAACLLFETRVNAEQGKTLTTTCRSHVVSRLPFQESIIGCTMCDFSECHQHLLAVHHIHSTEALFKHANSKAESPDWHQYHTHSQETKKNALEEMERATREGSRPENIRYQSWWIASRYQMVRPNAYSPERVHPGFYDAHMKRTIKAPVRAKKSTASNRRSSPATTSNTDVDLPHAPAPLSTPLTNLDLILPSETLVTHEPTETDNGTDALVKAVNRSVEVSVMLFSPEVKETYISPSPKRSVEDLVSPRRKKKRRTDSNEWNTPAHGPRTRSERRKNPSRFVQDEDSLTTHAHELGQSTLPLLLRNAAASPSNSADYDKHDNPSALDEQQSVQIRRLVAKEVAATIKELNASMKKQEQEYRQKVQAQAAKLEELESYIKSFSSLPRDQSSRNTSSNLPNAGLDELRSHIRWLVDEIAELRKSQSKQLKDKDEMIKALHNNFKEFRAQTTEQMSKMRASIQELAQQHAPEAKKEKSPLEELVEVIQKVQPSDIRHVAKTISNVCQVVSEKEGDCDVGGVAETDDSQTVRGPDQQSLKVLFDKLQHQLSSAVLQPIKMETILQGNVGAEVAGSDPWLGSTTLNSSRPSESSFTNHHPQSMPGPSMIQPATNPNPSILLSGHHQSIPTLDNNRYHHTTSFPYLHLPQSLNNPSGTSNPGIAGNNDGDSSGQLYHAQAHSPLPENFGSTQPQLQAQPMPLDSEQKNTHNPHLDPGLLQHPGDQAAKGRVSDNNPLSPHTDLLPYGSYGGGNFYHRGGRGRGQYNQHFRTVTGRGGGGFHGSQQHRSYPPHLPPPNQQRADTHPGGGGSYRRPRGHHGPHPQRYRGMWQQPS